MASKLFQDYRVKNAPPWLQDGDGKAWLESLGAIDDGLVDDAIVAAQTGYPDYGPVDALPKIGAERGIERGPADTDAVYQRRLREAWETWQRAGSALAILLALEAQGYNNTNGSPALVQQNGVLHTLDADTAKKPYDRLITTDTGLNPAIGGTRPIAAGTVPWWVFDSGLDADNDQFNSRFALLIPVPPSTWTNVVAPPTSGTAPTKNEVNTITRTVNQWKRATAKFMGTWVFGNSTGVAVTWGYPVTQTWGQVGLAWGGGAPAGPPVVIFDATEYA